jgi:hypothetical protein
MKDRRDIARTRVRRNVEVLIADRVPPFTCTVHDLTTKGAGLSIPATQILPSTFELSFDSFRTMRHCRMVWQRKREIGVAFVT